MTSRWYRDESRLARGEVPCYDSTMVKAAQKVLVVDEDRTFSI
jgi:hypothetical protein